MFMKIDTNCDGTVDWVRINEQIVMYVIQSMMFVSDVHDNNWDMESVCSACLILGSDLSFFALKDEFCTFMLLEYREKDSMAGEKLPPYPYPVRMLHR